MWGLPQAGISANKLGYSECVNTPRLRRHKTRPISFTLVVDDFGVKHASKDDVCHLTERIKSTYKLTKDWMGNLYCRITLEWDYINRHIDNKLQEYEHIIPTHMHSCLYHTEPKKLGRKRKPPSLPTLPLPLMWWELNKFKRLLAAYYTMHGPLT